MAFSIKQGDTVPNIPFQVFQPDGVTPANLTGATVRIVVRTKGGNNATPVLFKKPCVLTSAATGVGYYDWETGDTSAAGAFEYEFEITYGDGEIQTVPVDSYLDLVIVDDIG
jgi:hypothetical protein